MENKANYFFHFVIILLFIKLIIFVFLINSHKESTEIINSITNWRINSDSNFAIIKTTNKIRKIDNKYIFSDLIRTPYILYT